VALFTTAEPEVKARVPDTFEGDDERGAELALVHCGRCHVVDQRNKWGGIGSSPSFRALRGRENWLELFSAFHLKNPHPSFTQIEGVTAPFERTPAVAPVEMTVDELDAILAFVSGLSARDLGAEVQAR
jgi:mono/diheme cytochrome c family protein